jgi:fermentation-respiration switch protein FrsA (DUF1100 family)
MLLAYVGLAWYAMERVTGRRPYTPASPADLGLPFEEVSFPARDGLTLRGWFIPAADPTARRTVIFGHGHAGSMDPDLKYAPHFRARGFNVLMFDFRGHGRSDGHYTSMGCYERRDMLGAVDYLEQRGLGPIGVLGFSMGGAVGIGAAGECPAIRALVSDGAFARVSETLQQGGRRMGVPGWAIALVSPLTAWLLQRRLGCRLSEADPIRWIGRISPRPVFLIHGEADAYISVAQVQAMYEAAGEPKELWIAPGAGHRLVDEVYPEEYLARVLGFFERGLS